MVRCATCRDIFSWWPIFWNCIRWKKSHKEKLNWRRTAAIMGYLDVVLSLVIVIGVVACGVLYAIVLIRIEASKKQPAQLERERIEAMRKTSSLTNYVNDTKPAIYHYPKTPLRGDFVVSITATWIAAGIAFALAFLQLVAAIRMLKATEYEYNVNKAAGPVQFWVYVSVTLSLISFPLYYILIGDFGAIGYVLSVLVRIFLLVHIQQFLKELREFTGKKPQYKNIGKM